MERIVRTRRQLLEFGWWGRPTNDWTETTTPTTQHAIGCAAARSGWCDCHVEFFAADGTIAARFVADLIHDREVAGRLVDVLLDLCVDELDALVPEPHRDAVLDRVLVEAERRRPVLDLRFERLLPGEVAAVGAGPGAVVVARTKEREVRVRVEESWWPWAVGCLIADVDDEIRRGRRVRFWKKNSRTEEP